MANFQTVKSHWLVWVSVAVWSVAAIVALHHVTAWDGTLTLHWPNPARPTAHFRWTAPLTSRQPSHTEALLGAGERANFTVELPRGFVTGKVRIVHDGRSVLRVAPDMRPGAPSQARATKSPELVFDVVWSQLQARGRTFQFMVTNQGEVSARIRHISFQVER